MIRQRSVAQEGEGRRIGSPQRTEQSTNSASFERESRLGSQAQ